MATIVNNPGGDSSGAAAGWIVAAVVIVAGVLLALFVWPGYMRGGAGAPAAGDTNINVEVPAPSVGGESASGGAQ
jgi:hypothetical protein